MTVLSWASVGAAGFGEGDALRWTVESQRPNQRRRPPRCVTLPQEGEAATALRWVEW